MINQGRLDDEPDINKKTYEEYNWDDQRIKCLSTCFHAICIQGKIISADILTTKDMIVSNVDKKSTELIWEMMKVVCRYCDRAIVSLIK